MANDDIREVVQARYRQAVKAAVKGARTRRRSSPLCRAAAATPSRAF